MSSAVSNRALLCLHGARVQLCAATTHASAAMWRRVATSTAAAAWREGRDVSQPAFVREAFALGEPQAIIAGQVALSDHNLTSQARICCAWGTWRTASAPVMDSSCSTAALQQGGSGAGRAVCLAASR